MLPADGPASAFAECSAIVQFCTGWPPVVLQLRAGPQQIGLTVNTDSHILPELLKDAADRMNSVLAG